MKRNFRNSHIYPHFGAENPEILPQKFDTHNKLCSISESLGVRKLKIGMRGDHISISKCAKGFFEIHTFTPFLGPTPPKFASKMWIHHANNNNMHQFHNKYATAQVFLISAYLHTSVSAAVILLHW